eukprot:365469-Chlamydomonas_euryale.AAC.27
MGDRISASWPDHGDPRRLTPAGPTLLPTHGMGAVRSWQGHGGSIVMDSSPCWNAWEHACMHTHTECMAMNAMDRPMQPG